MREGVLCTSPHCLPAPKPAPDPLAQRSQSSALSCQSRYFHSNEHPHCVQGQEEGLAPLTYGQWQEVQWEGALKSLVQLHYQQDQLPTLGNIAKCGQTP